MASDAIGGAITFSTAIDNSDLEKGLEDAQKKVEELKESIESTNTQKSAIEQQMEDADRAIDATKVQIEELKAQIEDLNGADPMDPTAWWAAAQQIADNREKIVELNASLDEQYASQDRLNDQWQQLDAQAQQYASQLEDATATAQRLSQQVSSFYYQAGKSMQSSIDNVTASIASLGQRISSLFTSAMVFSVLRQGLDGLKNGIAAALQQNEAFSASWSYLQSAMQGFANGIANAVAPMLVSVINGVTACVMTLARAIDSVFKTSIASSISSAQKSAQAAWRQTDASKAAQKQAEANAKARAKQEEQFAKAQERYRKQQEAAEKRAAKAQEKLDERKKAQEQKYTDAVEDAAEKQAKAEQDMAEKMADAQETAQERMDKAQAKASERQAKAEETAQKRLAKAQEAAAERMAAAERSNAEKQQAAAERLAKAQEKASSRQQKAETKASQRLADAQEKASERMAAAEQANVERQQAADERLAKAQEKAQSRYEKAQAQAAEKTKAAQEAYDEKVAAAQAKDAKAAAAAETRQAKAAARLEKAQKKANETVLGFDELNKMSADSSEDAAAATDNLSDYTSALANIKPPKTYTVDPADYLIDPEDYKAKLSEIDPADYMVDPADYAIDPNDYLVNPDDYTAKLKEIDPSDYMVDPADYAINPEDYIINPADYAIDPEDYQIDPEDFFVDPEDYAFDPSEYLIDPEDYQIDPFSFDWQEFPEIGAEEGLKPNWDAFDVGEIDAKMAEIMAIMSGAMLAVGAILAFSGVNIPLGLALMAVGALELATIVGENWEKLPTEVQNAITNALVISGIALIVIGAILAFSGVNAPLGIGMMAAGFMLEWSAVALNWASMAPEVQAAVTAVMAVLSGAMFVIGVIIVLGVVDPALKALGVGLMLAGAAGLAASIALNWESLTPELQTALTNLMTLIGTFSIVIGVVLLLAVPGQQALGIGLIITGAALLGAAAALNWETLSTTLMPALQNALSIVGTFCLVIGVVLLFVPGQIALGVGLIIAGIAMIGASEVAADWESLNGQLATKLGEILQTIAYTMLVIGVILMFVPGQQGLGIGLIIGGIAVLAVSEVALNWEQLNADLIGTLGNIAQTLATYMLIIGVVLMFAPGQQALAAGLIIGGIALLAVSEIALNWEQLNTDLIGTLGGIAGTISTYMLVIGVILLFVPTQRALGIGLIIGGIALLAVSEAAIEWENTGDIEAALDRLAQTVATFMAIIGVVLLFVPGAQGWGIGLLIGGIAIFAVTALELDWETFPGELQTALTKLVTIISASLLVLGVVLLFASGGTAAPLAIGMIIAGAVGLATEVAINWDFIFDKIKEVWNKIKNWFNSTIKPIFTAEWWGNLFKSIINGLIGMLNSGLDMFGGFVNSIVGGINSILGVFGISGSSFTFTPPKIPYLAQGAVIPPNREFMAVLGDQSRGNNIETPEALMRQVVREEAGSVFAEMMMQMQAMGNGEQQGGGTELALYIDSEEIARASAKGTNSLTRRGVLSPSATFI